jgi:phospholipid/cholesterol/gamma-HCH transport system substrate-binding protein
MSRDGDHSPPGDREGRAAFEEGSRLAKSGQYEEAERSYRQAAEEGHPTGAAYAGLFAESHGDREEAERLYRQADEAGDGFGAFRLGMLLSLGGDWEAASEAWKRADERGQDRPPFNAVALAAGPEEHPESPETAATRSAFANPVLLGAVTVLVLLIGVFLAYNSNSGFPFVPTRELKVDIPNGTSLLPGNQVEVGGGDDIGIVSAMHPVRLSNGRTVAQLILQLTESAGPVPADSRVSIDTRSVLGLKYVNLHRGSSKRVLPDGATLPASQTTVPVQFDDINKIFDAKTRPAVQKDLVGFGDALAARGSSLNDTFAALPALLGHLTPVARYLSAPSTQLTRFLVALNGFFSTISPVAQVNAQLFGDQATTFEAISRSASDLENTIRESPPTLDVSTASLKVQQPFLVDLTTFSHAMQPATSSLKAALPQLDPALAAGIRVLPRTPSMNVRLEGVLRALKALALDPGTNQALNGLSTAVGILNPMIKYLGPFVTVCNTWSYFWADLADTVSQPTSIGAAQRALIMFGNHQTNNVNAQGATAPANGYKPGDVPDPSTADAEYYHGPAYGAAVTNQGAADCETGQRGYPLVLNHLDPHGRMLETDAHSPGTQGMNFTGLARVPAGETFTRRPTTGPQLPNIPSNP